MTHTPLEPRRRPRAGSGALVACLLVVALVGPFGCARSQAQVAAEQKRQCFANEAEIKTAIGLFHADSGLYPDVSNVVAQLHVACPAGGTYSFDQSTDTVSCSVHGHP